MLTKVLTLVLVVLFSLALADEQARYLYAHATGVDVSGAVNIHHTLGFNLLASFSLLATSGALLLSLSREWLSRQWTRFTVWLELTLDGHFDALLTGEMVMALTEKVLDSLVPVVDDAKRLHRPVRQCRGCSQCGETPAISLMNCGPRMMKLPPRSPPPNRDDSYIIEVGQNETHEDVVRRHPDVLFIQGDVLFKQAGTGPLTVRRKGEDSARTK